MQQGPTKMSTAYVTDVNLNRCKLVPAVRFESLNEKVIVSVVSPYRNVHRKDSRLNALVDISKNYKIDRLASLQTSNIEWNPYPSKNPH